MVKTTFSEFEQIVRDYQRPLYGFARRILGSREDAEEAVQDAFFRAHRALSAMPPAMREGMRLSPWLHTITLNVARNRLRKKRLLAVSLDAVIDPDRLLPGAATIDTPESALDALANREPLDNAIAKVPSYLQATARLRFIDGLIHAEIAEHFSESIGTIQSQVFRVVRMIRRILGAQRAA